MAFEINVPAIIFCSVYCLKQLLFGKRPNVVGFLCGHFTSLCEEKCLIGKYLVVVVLCAPINR